jgi:hypothetical protein
VQRALPAWLGALLEARHRLLGAAVESQWGPAAQARSPGPVAAVPQKRRPRSLQGPQALESRGERNPVPARPNRALAAGRVRSRRAAPGRAPASQAVDARRKRARPGGAPVPAPRPGLRPADGAAEAERAPLRAAPGDSFPAPVRSARGAVTLK